MWNRNMKTKSGCLLVIIVFGLILPLLSIVVEIKNYKEYTMDKPFSDSLEMVYTLCRFPIYWVVGILQLSLIGIKNRLRNN